MLRVHVNTTPHLLAVLGGGDVKVHVAISNVAIAHHPGHLISQPLPHDSDAVIEHAQGQRNVVFVAIAILQK